MRRPRFQRTPSRGRYVEDAMPSPPKSPTTSLRERDTGFPEPFCGKRNTSLPHPEANLAPDACLTEEDISVGRALVRHRMSFLDQERRRAATAPMGRPLSSMQDGRFSSSSSVLVNSDVGGTGFSTAGRLALTSLRGAALGGPGSSKDDDDSTHSHGMSSGESSPTHDTSPHSHHRRKSNNFIRRLMHR